MNVDGKARLETMKLIRTPLNVDLYHIHDRWKVARDLKVVEIN